MPAAKRKTKKVKKTKKANTGTLNKLRRNPKFNVVAAAVLVFGLIVLGYYIIMSRAASTVNVGRDLCGTWVLQQVSSADGPGGLNGYKTQINSALNNPGVIGLSVRFPWNAADISGSATTSPILDAARKIVDDYNAAHPGANKQLSIRFMAGRHAPDRVLNAPGVNTYLKGGEEVGVPWGDGSTVNNYVPNTAWLNEYDAYVGKLAAWSRSHNVKLLHLSWWAQDWAELNNGAEVRAVAGYSKNNWMNGHKALIDIGAKYAGDDLTVELPLSGYGPLSDGTSATLADYIISKVGPNSSKFFIQANGWGPGGEWGAPNQDVEKDFDAIWAKPIMRGLQMIQPQDYDWAQVYDRLPQNKATYAEVYLPSFAMANQADLKSEIAEFGQTCGTSPSSPSPSPNTPTPEPPTPSPNTPTPPPVTPTPTNGPVAISGLTRSLAFDWVKGRYFIQLAWKNNGGSASNYYLYAHDNKNNPVNSFVSKADGNVTSMSYYGPQPQGLANDTTYTLTVLGVNSAQKGDSATVTATTQCFWIFCSVR